MSNADLFLRFGVALALGFLIGLQREHSYGGEGREILAGERTFALLSLSGALSAMAADILAEPLIFIGALIFVVVLSGVAYSVEASKHGRIGITTEVAIFIAVLIGGLCYWGYLTMAAAIGITTTVVLSLKLETDRLVRSLTREDIFAALQFAVISAIVLPILPNEALWAPPFDVLNPFRIWLIVVLISGISFLGYAASKVVGAERGIGLVGFLGGMVSSTAVTFSFSQRSHKEPHLAQPMAMAIIVAWTMMFLRVLIWVAVVYTPLLAQVWLTLVLAGITGLAYSVFLYASRKPEEPGQVMLSNPFDLMQAIKFGLFYGLVLLVSRGAFLYFGNTGVLISSFFSGLADVDAITLSMSELSNSGGLSLSVAGTAIVVAVVANTLVKGGIVMSSADPGLKRAILPGLLLMVAMAIGTTLFI